jgi:hypothetical protein
MNDNMLTELYQDWQSPEWVNNWRKTSAYDGNGNRVTLLTEFSGGSIWIIYSRSTYTYDANGNSITGNCEIWINNKWEPGTGSFYITSHGAYAYYFDNIHRFEARFISFIYGINYSNYNNCPLSVFPNPATEKITIRLSIPKTNQISSIIIYGMDGRELIRQQVQDIRTEINVSSLLDGLYFIRLSNNEETLLGKFVKN